LFLSVYAMRLRLATDLDMSLARRHEHGHGVSMAAPRTHAIEDVSIEVFFRSRAAAGACTRAVANPR
jgi:hypothetical protein